MASKRYGLILTLGGATHEPYTVPGLPGYYFRDVPVPVGGEGEMGLDEARKAAKEIDIVKVVEIPPGEIEAAKEQAEFALEAGRKGLAVARTEGAEASRLEDERKALAAAQKEKE